VGTFGLRGTEWAEMLEFGETLSLPSPCEKKIKKRGGGSTLKEIGEMVEPRGKTNWKVTGGAKQ